MKKERAIPIDMYTAASPEIRRCDKDGCDKEGEFKAPKHRSKIREYYWFCLEHVQEYNKSWDFYKGMSAQEIEESRYSDVTWNRPSWPLGGWRTLLENAELLEDVESFLKSRKQPTLLPKPVQKALEVLTLTYPLTMEGLKKQYKKLAKQYHPDLNQGDQQAEDRLKDINQAYQELKKFLSS